jgi:L-lactate dehydrogenase complex protein LldE
MDAFQPEVGVATPELLERLGSTVDYPFDQLASTIGRNLTGALTAAREARCSLPFGCDEQGMAPAPSP